MDKCVLQNNATFWSRIVRVAEDLIILGLGMALFILIVSCGFYLLCLLKTWPFVAKMISACPQLPSEAVWPTLIVILVVIFREHVVSALGKVPGFIERYPGKDIDAADNNPHVDEAVPDDEDGSAENTAEAHANPTGNRVNDAEMVKTGESGKCSDPKPGNGGVEKSSCTTREEIDRFVNHVLTILQKETRTVVVRNVNLFKNKSIVFDGAMAQGNVITGIEVLYQQWRYKEKLQKFDMFYKSLSQREKNSFKLLFCVRGPEKLLTELQSYREQLSLPVEFRCFGKNGEEHGNQIG